ncbi:MAG TPA: oligosaccharide flippase family protein [Draconibacterium sp.]|nr:oligosaccharide flippase family protein [Draconibacterium sp.]
MKNKLNSISAFQFYQLVRYATLILIGVVFTKTAITQTEIGEYETFVFIASAVSYFWLNGLQKALLPVSATNKDTKSHIFSAFVILQLFSILAAVFLFLMQPVFSEFLLNGKNIPEIGLLVVFIVFGVPANLIEYYYIIKKRNVAIVVYSVVSFSVQLILVTLPAILDYGISAALKGLVLSAVLRYIWLLIILITNREIHYSNSFVKEHLKLGGPLILATFLSGSAQFVDGFIVTSYFDEGTFAVFRYGARELPLAMLLANALSTAMLPDFALENQLRLNLQKLKQSVTRLSHFLFPLTAVLLLITHSAFPIIFNSKFSESATIFNIYLLIIISRLMLPQTLLNGLKIMKPIMTAALLELIVNVSMSLILVQFLGINGIAYATFIAYFFEKIYLSIEVKRKMNVSINEYIPLKIYTIYSLTILAIFVLVEFII